MLHAGKVLAGGILDGRLGQRVAVPADTSVSCTRSGDQEDGVVLCEGRVGNVLVSVAFLAVIRGKTTMRMAIKRIQERAGR